jgi:D-3-phosphoglycerate dehydrogenase
LDKDLKYTYKKIKLEVPILPDYKFKVTHVGVHTQEAIDMEKIELEQIGARQIVTPPLDSEEDMVTQTEHSDGMIIMESMVSLRTMEASPNCKVILRTGVGVDTIDIDAATKRGIAVVNVPDIWIREVANHAMALLLACNRRIFLLDHHIRKNVWHKVIPPPVGAIHGETLGIIGLGQIGKSLAKRAIGFEMNLIAYDPYIDQSVFEEYGVKSVSFEELLTKSDYISIHTPLTDETRHMFDEKALRKMKPTSYLINTARGPIVEISALEKALQNKWISGAGIDVFEQEPMPVDNPILKMDNVIMTPHAGYYSDPALKALGTRCGQEVARVLLGKKPLFLVNPDVLQILPLK